MVIVVITLILDRAPVDLAAVLVAGLVDLVVADLVAVGEEDLGNFFFMKFSEEFLVVRKRSALAR